MVPIACIMLKGGPRSDLFERAVELFRKAMKVFRDISSGFAMARTMLRRLAKIVCTVEQSIDGRDKNANGKQAPDSIDLFHTDMEVTYGPEPGQLNSNLFDLLYEEVAI